MRTFTRLSTIVASCMLLAACHADSLPAQKQQADALVTKTLNHLSFVAGGAFMMGDFGPEQAGGNFVDIWLGARPVHKVTLDSFSMMQYKVTYADFDVYSAATGTPKVAQSYGIGDTGTEVPLEPTRRQPDRPANVNWQPARDYCRWLGRQTGLPFDLPTEAQWEYAARNRGQLVRYATDNGQLDDGRNLPSAKQRDEVFNKPGEGDDYPVGRYPPSPLGLYDMAYNGQEWMLDWFAVDYYAHSPEHNPQGPARGNKYDEYADWSDGQPKQPIPAAVRVLRGDSNIGGGWGTGPEQTVWRSYGLPDGRQKYPSKRKDAQITEMGEGTVRCVVNSTQPVKH